MSVATQIESRAETPRLRRQGETATLGRTLLAAAALAGIYFVAGTLGLRLAYVHESATAVWPPSGIAIAALLLGGYALAAGVFVGAFLVNLLNPNTYGAVGLCLGIGVGNLLEALLGAWLVTRFAGGRRFIDRAAHLARFAFLAGLVSTLASSLVGVTSLC